MSVFAIRMAVSILVTGWMLTATVTAQDAVHPFAIVFLNNEIDVELRLDRNRQLARTIGKRSEEDITKIRRGIFHDMIIAEPDYEYVRGNAHFSTISGKYISSKFITVADEKAFRRLIEIERANRSATTTTVEEGVGNIRLVTPPSKFIEDGKDLTVEYKDLFYRYSNGFLCTGGPEIFDIDMSEVRPFVDSARHEHTLLQVFPPRVTKQTREYYLNPVLMGLNVVRQRRDKESDAEFESRTAAADLVGVVLRGMFDDVDQLTVSVRYPTSAADELHVRGVARIQENSKFALLLQQLRPTLSQQSLAPDDALVSLKLNLGMPEELRRCLTALVAVHWPESPGVQELVNNLLDNDSVQLEAWAGLNDRTEPYVRGTMPIQSETFSQDDFAELLRLLVMDFQNRSRFDVSGHPVFANHVLKIAADQGLINLEWGVPPDAIRNATSEPEPHHHVCDLRVDFASFVATDQDAPVRLLINQLEEQDFEFSVNQHPLISVMPYPPRAIHKPFYSKLSDNKALKGRLIIDVSMKGNELVFDLRCDGELYRLRDARIVLQHNARRKLAGFE